MHLKNTVKELFSFTRTGRIGFLLLLLAIVIVAVFPFLYTGVPGEESALPDSSWLQTAEALQPYPPAASSVPRSGESEFSPVFERPRSAPASSEPPGTLFNFDPNQLDEAGFKKLGLRDRTIRVLLNYRSKGGQFKKPEDLAKIYGLRPDEFRRLEPFIKIPSRITAPTSGNYPTTHHTQAPEKKPYRPKTIEINTASTADFESLYGIGPKLAARIINFREKLGGFYRIEQVGETYGVADSVFQQIKPQLEIQTDLIKKININSASYEDLNAHPYISAKTAFQLLKYRKEKGHVGSLDEIKDLVQPSDSFEKIAPYLIVE